MNEEQLNEEAERLVGIYFPHKETDESIRKQLAHRLQMLRTFKRLSQQELSDIAGIKRGTVGNIELGRQGTTITQLVKLANALNVELWVLFAPTPLWQDAMKGYL